METAEHWSPAAGWGQMPRIWMWHWWKQPINLMDQQSLSGETLLEGDSSSRCTVFWVKPVKWLPCWTAAGIWVRIFCLYFINVFVALNRIAMQVYLWRAWPIDSGKLDSLTAVWLGNLSFFANQMNICEFLPGLVRRSKVQI